MFPPFESTDGIAPSLPITASPIVNCAPARCEQIDAAHDDVSSQTRGIHYIDAEQLRDHTQVFGLGIQRHL